jgi:hypothetical protein
MTDPTASPEARAIIQAQWKKRLHGDCPTRWDDPEVPDPGPCQCSLDKGHDGAHSCCCGASHE